MGIRVDWDKLPEDVLYVAVDFSGDVHGFAEQPFVDDTIGVWDTDGGSSFHIESTGRNWDNWTITLTPRPGMVTEEASETVVSNSPFTPGGGFAPCSFGCLDRSEKVKLFESWIDGKPIEYWDGKVWVAAPAYPRWDPSIAYRVPVVKPSIDWSHVAPAYKWLAVDKDGFGYLYEHQPGKGRESWDESRVADNPIRADYFASFNPGTSPWDQSLVERS